MTSLQLGLIAAGVALVLGVVIYNWVQERRVRRRIEQAFRSSPARDDVLLGGRGRAGDRVEPTLGTTGPAASGGLAASVGDDEEALFELPLRDRDAAPLDAVAQESSPSASIAPAAGPATNATRHAGSPSPAPVTDIGGPDPEIESLIPLQPAQPVGAGALGAVLSARLGKRLRWFGRDGRGQPWVRLAPDTAGEFSELVACLLLADRTGAASKPMLDAFARLVADVAPTLPAAFTAPDAVSESERAEALDRLCAELDVQIGLTVQRADASPLAGTRLRGVAEAAGFRLAGGRFEWVQEDTGAVLYTLQNFRSEAFTPDNLRVMTTPGVVFLLDVPRVRDPVRVFEQMKLAARRMTQTLDADLVDDNRRPLDDTALAVIRQDIASTAKALIEINVEPGSPRALALFGG